MSIFRSPDFSLPAFLPNSVCVASGDSHFLDHRVKELNRWPRALLPLQETDLIYQWPQKDTLHQLTLWCGENCLNSRSRSNVLELEGAEDGSEERAWFWAEARLCSWPAVCAPGPPPFCTMLWGQRRASWHHALGCSQHSSLYDVLGEHWTYTNCPQSLVMIIVMVTSSSKYHNSTPETHLYKCQESKKEGSPID